MLKRLKNELAKRQRAWRAQLAQCSRFEQGLYWVSVSGMILVGLWLVTACAPAQSRPVAEEVPALEFTRYCVDERAEVWQYPTSESERVATLEKGSEVHLTLYFAPHLREIEFAEQGEVKRGYVTAARVKVCE